jgi:hypothetical protein
VICTPELDACFEARWQELLAHMYALVNAEPRERKREGRHLWWQLKAFLPA